MLDAGVFVAGFALVAFAWNLGRMNNVMKKCELEGCKTGCKSNEGCQSNDPRGVENLEDWNWNVQCSENADPVARCVRNSHDSRVSINDPDGDEWNTARSALCVRNVQEVDFGAPSNDADGDGDETKTTECCGEGAQPTERDIVMFKEAKRREHFEGMVPGSLTPYPWRSMYYGRGRPRCARRLSSLSSSGYNMAG